MSVIELCHFDMRIDAENLQFSVCQYPFVTKVRLVGPRGGRWGDYNLTGMIQLLSGDITRLQGQTQGDKTLTLNRERTVLRTSTAHGHNVRTYQIDPTEISQVVSLLPQEMQNVRLDFEINQADRAGLVQELEDLLEEYGIVGTFTTQDV